MTTYRTGLRRVLPDTPREPLTEERVRAILREAERVRRQNALPYQRVHMHASAAADELIELCESWLEWRRTP